MIIFDDFVFWNELFNIFYRIALQFIEFDKLVLNCWLFFWNLYIFYVEQRCFNVTRLMYLEMSYSIFIVSLNRKTYISPITAYFFIIYSRRFQITWRIMSQSLAWGITPVSMHFYCISKQQISMFVFWDFLLYYFMKQI